MWYTDRSDNSTTTTSGDCVYDSLGDCGFATNSGSGSGVDSSSIIWTVSVVLCYELHFFTLTSIHHKTSVTIFFNIFHCVVVINCKVLP